MFIKNKRKGVVIIQGYNSCRGDMRREGEKHQEEKRTECVSAVPVKASDQRGLFLAAPGVNGSAGACHSQGQHGTIRNDDGGTDLCQDAEPSCQSNHSAL